MISLCLCLVCFYVISVFSVLVCLFPCLFRCLLFRAYLVFRSTSSVIFVCVYLCVSVYWGSLGLRVVLGSCVSDSMISNQGSLLTYSNSFLLEKHSINQERIRRLLDAQEFHVG